MSSYGYHNTGGQWHDGIPQASLSITIPSPTQSSAVPKPTQSTALPKPAQSIIMPESTQPIEQPKLNMPDIQAQYKAMVRVDSDLRARIRKYIEENWWKDLCRSACNNKFYLFDKHLFDDEGVLDVKMPAYRKILQSLAMVYLYIVDKSGKDSLSDWRLSWAINDDGAPFIHYTNPVTGQTFGITEPKTGFVDHANELKTLRKRREAGKHLRSKIPADKLKYYTSPKPTNNALSGESEDIKALQDAALALAAKMKHDTGLVGVALSPAQSAPQGEEGSELDGGEWYIFGDEDTKLAFSVGNEIGDDDFGEARRLGEQNNGYVYNAKDSVSAPITPLHGF
ncbi:hypothetical protein K505DRAFT_339937 [Melanomma pulvis-pyrius CBS 109.77]|uniref:Uncharacterized protein n=1 Tax=Melanomma pulvis-pyrius CBS 109.77 TaxID=1314802 RepID=A0A6A6X3Y0_9PLEO|nr:hypothetical protein K505DRAFT_339937 [Melanomma pulvis-pyrius CBS 109.77]